ncbi:MAG: response regulator [Hydrogenophaga sp.]|uniref:response regulator n=1 Tax=Hydrogenophaga sp. TaxID=1904254 RepID=UPI0016957064|nr:response regulator transcription factor [Hydrogenophaga sp.]NIM42194.1 response regulator [Hydrogenophaga sp.]NIN27487.1 response regulator [Hydrogenophaga sp.]NIN32188.1 response regulator [Hydrogenophaga sp.]NIN56440.1 response regulator [Hydrogenophaga sp.]NIO52747.1 response regulator [Hydrogenophaga sp.]
MRLLLAEDDTMLGQGLERGLGMAGFTVDWVRDGLTAQTALQAGGHEVLLLDIGLPRQDGLQLLRWMREQPLDIPVLVVSARDAVSDRIAGLNLGADDYLTKPFDLDELIARVHALARRRQGRPQPEMRLGPLMLSPPRREVTLGEQRVPLSAREFDLLAALMERPGQVLSREQLEQRLYARQNEVLSNAVEVHLHHLRRKLGAAWIRNVRGVGYKLVEPPP